MVIDTRWIDSPGYRPVRVRIEMPGKKRAARERRFEIRLAAESSKTKLVHTQITMPKGASMCEAILLVPQESRGFRNHMIRVECFEEGRRLDYLTVAVVHWRRGQSTFETESLPTGLFIDSDAPTFEDRRYGRQVNRGGSSNHLPFGPYGTLVGRYASRNLSIQPSSDSVLELFQLNPHCELLHPADLPQRWLGLSCFDVVYLAAAELSDLKQSDPTRFAALLDWLATGGSLVVFDGGDTFDKLPEIALQFGFTADETETGWRAVEKERYALFLPSHRNRRVINFQSQHPPEQESWDDVPELRERPYVMGKVYVIGSDQPFQEPAETWDVLFNSIAENHQRWRERHGFLVAEPEIRFYQFLIPGVGLPPVTTFRALIAIFAILIGPVSYIILMRQRRLYLMLAIVPITGLIICVALIGYAFVADGFTTQARINSYSEIDHQIGRMTTWSRQSYYSGIAPRDGIIYGEDTAVYPIVNEMPDHVEYSTAWRGDRQQLTKGNIGSRATSQFLTVESGPASSGLIIDESPVEDDGAMEVTNDLDGRILAIALVDSRGNAYHALDVGPKVRFRATRIENSQVAPIIRPFILAEQPRYPNGLDTSHHGRSTSYVRSLSRFVDYNYDNKGTLDWKYDEILQGSGTEFLKPRSYLMVLEPGTQKISGVPTSRIVSGLSVVRGTW